MESGISEDIVSKDLTLSHQVELTISKWEHPSMKDVENGLKWTEVQPINPNNR